MTDPLDPQVSYQDIDDLLDDNVTGGSTALWLDRDCVIIENKYGNDPSLRYEIYVSLTSGCPRTFDLFQVPGTTEPGALLPALEYFITRATNDQLHCLRIRAQNDDDDLFSTLDVSMECFSHLLQTSLLNRCDRVGIVQLVGITLTAEQTAMLFSHDTGPMFIELQECRFHGPTLLQVGLAAPRWEQTRSYLEITLDDEEILRISHGELTALLSNAHLRSFRAFTSIDGEGGISYEVVKKIVSVLAAIKISSLESLFLGDFNVGIEWKKEEELSAWIDLWKAIEGHPSLKEVHLADRTGLCQPWQPIAAAAEVNPGLVHVSVDVRCDGLDRNQQYILDKKVGPLLEINRFRPEIAALCCSDPSKAAALLVRAIVVIAREKYMHSRCKRDILRMLVNELVLTGYDFGE